jgi:hypothetical protein
VAAVVVVTTELIHPLQLVALAVVELPISQEQVLRRVPLVLQDKVMLVVLMTELQLMPQVVAEERALLVLIIPVLPLALVELAYQLIRLGVLLQQQVKT